MRTEFMSICGKEIWLLEIEALGGGGGIETFPKYFAFVKNMEGINREDFPANFVFVEIDKESEVCNKKVLVNGIDKISHENFIERAKNLLKDVHTFLHLPEVRTIVPGRDVKEKVGLYRQIDKEIDFLLSNYRKD